MGRMEDLRIPINPMLRRFGITVGILMMVAGLILGWGSRADSPCPCRPQASGSGRLAYSSPSCFFLPTGMVVGTTYP